MVASSLSAKSPPLSYAERAKKAQSIRSPIEVVQQPQRTIQTQTPAIPLAPSTSSTSSSSQKSSATSIDSPSVLPFRHSTTSSIVPSASASSVSEAKITNGDSHATTNTISKISSITDATLSTQKSPPVNVWDRRKEEFAARNIASQKTISPQAPTLTARVNSDSQEITQNSISNSSIEAKRTSTSPPSAVDDEDDPFVVKTSRAPRPHLPAAVPTYATGDVKDWPKVGKSVTPPISSTVSESNKEDESRGINAEQTQSTSGKKGGQTKWIPIPPHELQAAADAAVKESRSQTRKDSHGKGNRQGANLTQSYTGQGRNSRNHSGRNSTNQSASHSRIQSHASSVQSSPRLPRNKRLPGEETHSVSLHGSTLSAKRSSKTNSPLNASPRSQGGTISTSSSLFSPGENPSHTPSYGGYLSPPNGINPYYSPQPIPPLTSPMYRPPSHGPPLAIQPDPSLPMPSTYPYFYSNPYVPYEYGPPASFPYWNSQSHPGSGQHSPAYPPPNSSGYDASLTHHVQQHFYPRHIQPYQQSQGSHSAVTSTSQVSPDASDKSALPNKLLLAGGTEEGSTNTSALISDDQLNGKERWSGSVVFGSLGSLSESQCPSPVPTQVANSTTITDLKEGLEKSLTSLAIGVSPDDAVLKSRKGSSGKPTKLSRPSVTTTEHKDKDIDSELIVNSAITKEAGISGETKWKFGNLDGPAEDSPSIAQPAQTTLDHAYPTVASGSSTQPYPHDPSYPPTSYPIVNSDLDDDFKVKNFGYGFGAPVSGDHSDETSKEAGAITQQAAEMEDVEPESSIDNQRGENAALQLPHSNIGGVGRNRRGSYGGSYSNVERGSYNGRRTRGMNGYGRGRGYGRGGSNTGINGNMYTPRQAPPPFNATPPPTFQNIPPVVDPNTGYYAPPISPYIPPGYEHYPPPPPPPAQSTSPNYTAPPMPVPSSKLSFPLDPRSFYLLGQLEYYLSPENLAQDYWLRRQMDAHGWISIALIASFNRVQRLSADYQLVRDVLSLSTVVEVKDHFVRALGWEQFVLPDAPPSTVGNTDYSQIMDSSIHSTDMPNQPDTSIFVAEEGTTHQQANAIVGEIEGEEEDEEEDDDVVFVMGKDESNGMWSHEKRT